MSPDEFLFLALGLALGVAAGAALLDVIRSRPPRPEVRLTITHNALPRGASDAAEGHSGAALAAWQSHDPIRPPDPPAPLHLRAPEAPVPPLLVVPGDGAGDAAMRTSDRVPIRVGRGLDPTLAALRAVDRERRPLVAAGTGPGEPAGRVATKAEVAANTDGWSRGGEGKAGGGDSGPRMGGTSMTSEGQGPCAAERLLADERCSVASQARERADQVAAELREAQRAYDEAAARADAAGRESDPRAVAAAKEEARAAFHAASARATDRQALERAATAWLGEINRINLARRDASEQATQARVTCTELLGTIERLTLVADASRITAEAAANACTEARQVLADCQEAASRPRQQPGPAGAVATASITAVAPGVPPSAALSDLPDAEDAAVPVGSAEPAIFRLLQGDGATLERVSDELGGGDRQAAERMQRLLGALVDSVVSGAIESCVLDFPIEHAFWGDFNRAQCRDIALALASLGYRFDGLGGFIDDRVPSQRDLSLAVGYAGLDPMRIRRWPGEAEMRALYGELRVAADEYLAGRAPDLTLGEMVALLGRRSESLADLWNAWGRARPALLSTAE